MDKYLIALDMDGTLLNSNREISNETKEYLKKLSKQGHTIVISSGRPFRSIKKYYDELELTSPSICYNGAYIHSDTNLFDDFTFSFTYEECLQIYNEIGKENLENVLCENNENLYLLHEDDILWKYFWLKDINVIYGDLEKTLNQNPIIMIFRAKNQSNEIKDKIKKVMDNHPGINIRFWSGLTEFSEIYYNKVSKANALKRIMKELGYDKKNVIAIGDALNDIEMIECAEIGVAMKNSSPELIKKAKYVTEFANNQDGIKHFLENFFK